MLNALFKCCQKERRKYFLHFFIKMRNIKFEIIAAWFKSRWIPWQLFNCCMLQNSNKVCCEFAGLHSSTPQNYYNCLYHRNYSVDFNWMRKEHLKSVLNFCKFSVLFSFKLFNVSFTLVVYSFECYNKWRKKNYCEEELLLFFFVTCRCFHN